MSQLLWNPQPDDKDDGKLVGAFLVMTLVMWVVVVIGQLVR